MLFHKIPYFLQLFAENWMKTPKHGSFHEELLLLAKSIRFDGFSQTLMLFATGSLNKSLVLAKSTSFVAFSQNAIFFATFLLKT